MSTMNQLVVWTFFRSLVQTFPSSYFLNNVLSKDEVSFWKFVLPWWSHKERRKKETDGQNTERERGTK